MEPISTAMVLGKFIIQLCKESGSGGKVSLMGGDSNGHYKKKKSLYEHVSNSERSRR